MQFMDAFRFAIDHPSTRLRRKAFSPNVDNIHFVTESDPECRKDKYPAGTLVAEGIDGTLSFAILDLSDFLANDWVVVISSISSLYQ